MRKITIKDIAERLNLSVSTVSRALSDDKNIRASTKEKIFRTAREMGYVRNFIASQLRTGKGKTVGVLVDELSSPYASRVLKGITAVMNENQGFVVIYNADHDPEQERAHMDYITSSGLAGVIALHLHNFENIPHYRRLADSAIPVVFVTFTLDGIEASAVAINTYDKAFFLFDHIICSGKRRIALVQGPMLSPEMKEIDKAYREAMAKFSLPVDKELILQGCENGFTTAEGERLAKELLDSGVDFDAVFAPTELVAIGMMNCLRKNGRRIPEDVAVACFKGSSLSEMVYPAITSVHAPLEEIGRRAAELVIEHIKDPGRKKEKVILNAKIQLRGSTHPEPQPVP